MKNVCNMVKKRAKVHNMQSASALSSVKKKKKVQREWFLKTTGQWLKEKMLNVTEAVLFFCKMVPTL